MPCPHLTSARYPPPPGVRKPRNRCTDSSGTAVRKPPEPPVWWHQDEVPARHGELRMPTGDVDLVIDLGKERALVSGPSTLAFLLSFAERRQVMGAVFRIGGAARLFGVPLGELRDRHVPLPELWGSAGWELLERPLAASRAEAKLNALEQALSTRLGHTSDSGHPVTGRAAAQIARHPERCRIDELSEALGLSARRLEQLFRTEVGLTPKAYQRLHRFRSALAGIDRAAEIGWASFALERGYYDQAHLIGEFRAHSGLTPSQYLSSRGAELNHVPVSA
ncbi:MAG: helix-turn-helix domain-containing protein [Gaiellaceae bacterium]